MSEQPIPNAFLDPFYALNDGGSPSPGERTAEGAAPGAAPGSPLVVWATGRAEAGQLVIWNDYHPGQGQIIATVPVPQAGPMRIELVAGVTPPPPPPPPPPPVAVLTGLTLTPASVVSGQSVTGEVTLSAPATAPVTVALASFTRDLTFPANVTVPPGQTRKTFSVATPAGLATEQLDTVIATLGGVRLETMVTIKPSLSPPPPPPPPPPPIGKTKNVMDYGAKGDNIADDRAAVQRAVSAASRGDTVYFPGGHTYRLSDYVQVRQDDLAFFGDGPGSVIHHEHTGWQIGSGTYRGLSIRRLTMLGAPGKYQLDGNGATAIMCEIPTKAPLAPGELLLVDDCDFIGCGWAYRSGGGSSVLGDGSRWPVLINNCRVRGWGVCAFFCCSGELIQSCQAIQDDPGLRSSHGIYVMAGCRDVLVRDTLIRGARKWGTQVWCMYPNVPIDGVSFDHVTWDRCQGGLLIARSEVAAMSIKNVSVRGCAITGTVADALHINTGTGIFVRDTTLDGGENGLVLDGPKGEITDLLMTGGAIRNMTQHGVLVQPNVPPAGTFARIQVSSPISGCRVPVNLAGASGIVVG